MEKITFENAKGISVELGNEGPFVLTKVQGAGAVHANISTEKSPFQDGVSYVDNTLEPRSLSLEVVLIAHNRDEMVRWRRLLIQAFNPKLGPGRLVYEFGGTSREIAAMAEFAPVYPDARPFEDTIQPALIELFCPVPFWLETYDEQEELVVWLGGMTFPWQLPSMFATKGPSRVNLVNRGDVETPVTITIKGPATNPKITNHTMGKYIQAKQVLVHGDQLVIRTHFGGKRVEVNGVNVFHWIDPNSVFWQLQPGDNIVEYSSDDPVEPAAVTLSYRDRFVGV